MQNYQEMMQGTFDQITQIGAGGGGTIFKAHHKRLDKEVVLKKIHTSQLNYVSHRGELDLLKNLKHNYIPQVLDFIEYGDEVFTVMEYIPGQSFAQLLEQGRRFSQKEVKKWMCQLCEVVTYLHSQTPPIIHCDIKPANVMLTPAGDICLIDFNISGVKTEEGIASIGYSVGYAPVEQFSVVARRLESILRTQGSQPQSVNGTQAAVNKTGILPGNGIDRTEILPGQGIDRTEILPGQGMDRTEILPSQGIDRTAVLPGQGMDRTEILPGQGIDRTAVLPGQGADRTEILPNQGIDRTEILPAQGVRGGMASSSASVDTAPQAAAGQAGRSLMSHMSDEEWAIAKQVEASVGKFLTVDERTDIYSIGCTLYHILTGVRPRPFYQMQVPIHDINPKVSESLAYVIEKAMAVSPAGRFKSSAEMLKVVRNISTVDKRYKSLCRKQVVTAILTGALTAASVFVISLGRSTMAQERTDQYRMYIEAMEDARGKRDYDSVSEHYRKATELFAGEQDAYYEMSLAYYEQRQYEQCIDFLSRDVYNNSDLQADAGFGRFDYITGSCYFELEDYNAAAAYFARAVELQPEEISYYRDYVVSLARDGAVDKAEQVLDEAQQKGLSADVLSLLNGEIALLRGNYQECWQYLTDSVAGTTDDYIKLRAYTKLDDACQLMYADAEQCSQRVTILTEALEALPAEYQITLIERLAQAHIDYSDIEERDFHCESAIALFQQMENLGYATFTSRYNVAILYDKMEAYDDAQAQLDAMLDTYPDNYMIYKRKAFVELEAQAAKDNTDRDYHTFESFYEQAQQLYQSIDREDMEMLSLQQLYHDVAANGWLDAE